MQRPAFIRTRRASAVLLCTPLLLFACDSTTGLGPDEEPKVVNLEAMTVLRVGAAVATEVTPVPVVRARYEDGSVAAGVAVSFTATRGGTVDSSSAVTDSAGRASPGAWRLGTTLEIQTLTALVGESSLIFLAYPLAGPVATLTAAGGDGLTAAAGATLHQPLRARALDRFGNPVAGVAVTFVVVDGGGAIAADTALTDVGGRASSGPWALGPVVGEQRVRATSGSMEALFTVYTCDPALCYRLAYVTDHNDIAVIDEVTGLVQRLTYYGGDDEPAWSPDGSRIAFTRGYGSSSSAIWVMNADGSEPTQVVSGNVSAPSWSPDGDSLVFQEGNCVYDCDIYVQSLAEESVRRHLATSAAKPAWSPDGSRIVFVVLSGDDGYHYLATIRPDGTDMTALTLLDDGGIYGTAWSPDGTMIAFAKCLASCEIHTVRPDGSEPRLVTNVGNAFSPAWSADGTRIAFARWSDGTSYIAWVPAVGGTAIPLIDPGRSPAWRPR